MPTSESSLRAVYEAVYDALVGDATLAALVGGAENIKNFEPQEPPRTFIVVGHGTEQESNMLGGIDTGWGWDATVTVHIYSYYTGDIRALEILQRVTTLLNKPDGITVDGYSHATCRYGVKMTKVLIETKDKQERRHIPAIFSVKVQQ